MDDDTREAMPVCPECSSARIYREGDMVYREVPARAAFGSGGYEGVTEREAEILMGFRPGSVEWHCTDCEAEFEAPVPGEEAEKW